jgi:uncharacterized integral membrane protein
MKLFFWIVGLPLLLVAGFFAVANRETVAVSLWPFAESLQMPLFVAIAAPFYVGFALGALIAWGASGRGRGRAREAARRATTLQRENDTLKARVDELEARTSPSSVPAVPSRSIAGEPPVFLP